MKSNATAIWNGTGKEGKGIISTHSNVLSKVPYSFKTRFEEYTGTNPEELIAAAHSACFSMKLAFILNENGFTADSLETNCVVTMDKGAITGSHLELKGKVAGISKEDFQKHATDASKNCPVSKALSISVTLNAALL
jgi:lipoyl-dependent peroxiredoxin